MSHEPHPKPQPPCPVCRAAVASLAHNPSFPFCGERCRQIDLGRWLQEDYRIPVTPDATERDLPESEQN